MADKLISELTQLTTGNIENSDWVEIQEADQLVTKKVTVEVLNEIEAAARAAQDDVIEAGIGANADGTYNTPSGTNHLDTSTSVMNALNILDGLIGATPIVVDEVSIDAANLNAAGLVPYEVIAAPTDANDYIDVISVSCSLDAGGTPTECGSQKFVLQYDTGATHFVEWSNAFIEGASDAVAKGTWTSEVDVPIGKKVEATFDGGVNPTAGTSRVKITIVYMVVDK